MRLKIIEETIKNKEQELKQKEISEALKKRVN